MAPVNGLSIIVITRNEEQDIEGCLSSVKALASEIILVDSGSTDRTIEIASRFTQKIFRNEWKGYGAQKQFALDKAMGPWVLNIDADERVTPALAEEIRFLLAANSEPKLNGYRIPFRHFFMGKPLRFGGVRGETHIRLFLKASSTYGKKDVHEGIEVGGEVGQLKGAIDHHSYASFGEYLEKCNEYTSTIAANKWKAGKRFHWWHHFRLPYEFVVRYGIKLGFLDGEAGLTYALLSSYYVWLKFLKLQDLGRRPPEGKS